MLDVIAFDKWAERNSGAAAERLLKYEMLAEECANNTNEDGITALGTSIRASRALVALHKDRPYAKDSIVAQPPPA